MNRTIDVISDVICPWCYIGKKRLERAVAAVDVGEGFRVRWLPFQLNPTMPKEGISRKEYRIRKFGSWERSRQLEANVIAVGETEGIAFDFDRIERTPNTVDAHRLIALADQEGCQDAVVEALFRAYFTEGKDIADHKTLIEVVARAGLEGERVLAELNSDKGMDEFRQAEEVARSHRVSGVPFFVIGGRVTLSGAQPTDVFLDAFRQVWPAVET